MDEDRLSLNFLARVIMRQLPAQRLFNILGIDEYQKGLGLLIGLNHLKARNPLGNLSTSGFMLIVP